MISFGQMPQRSGTWTWFKASHTTKNCSIQFEEDSVTYLIYRYDQPEVMSCIIWKGAVPSTVLQGYSQAQNDADKSDFETNYKAFSNLPITESTRDPRLIHKFGNLTSSSGSEVLMCSRGYAEPASQAQRSVVSTSVQDAAAGSGAKAVRITYLDSNYVLSTEDIALNGTNAVNTVSTTIRFIESFQIIQGAATVGAVKIMTAVAGGGTEITGINAAGDDANLCHHYVPAGKRAWVLGWGATVDNNANFKLKSQQRFGANLVDQVVDLENLPIANRSEFYRLFPGPLPVGEKCYIRVTVVPGQVQSTVERSLLDLWEDVA